MAIMRRRRKPFDCITARISKAAHWPSMRPGLRKAGRRELGRHFALAVGRHSAPVVVRHGRCLPVLVRWDLPALLPVDAILDGRIPVRWNPPAEGIASIGNSGRMRSLSAAEIKNRLNLKVEKRPRKRSSAVSSIVSTTLKKAFRMEKN